ncbi:MAG: hypothetical protein U0324_25650 [Polyangiales bacterium]
MADDPTEPPSSGTVDESTLVPVERDRRFVVRLVLLLLVGLVAATFIGAFVQRRAGACGRGLITPGSSVIPPSSPHR